MSLRLAALVGLLLFCPRVVGGEPLVLKSGDRIVLLGGGGLEQERTHGYLETLLVARAIAPEVLPPLAALYASKQVELRVCSETRKILAACGVSGLKDATEEDWRTEYLAPILSIATVSGLDEAIGHINRYGSRHTDAIVTENYERAMRFLREVDSASVMVNASTRFADGFEYGLGAEIGISNDKLHARGPVGLEGLTSQKFIVLGNGEVRTRSEARA